MELSGSFKCAKERDELNFFFFFWDAERSCLCTAAALLLWILSSGRCLDSRPAGFGGNTAWRRENKWVSWRPAGGTSAGGEGPAVPAAAPRRRSSPRPRAGAPLPTEPRCRPLREPGRALLQLIDCVARMLNLLISWVAWARTVNYPVASPPIAEMPGKFRVVSGNDECNFVLFVLRLFSPKSGAKYNCILRSWIQDSHFKSFNHLKVAITWQWSEGLIGCRYKVMCSS